MDKPTTLPKIQEADLDVIAPAAGARSLKRTAIAVGVVLLVGSGVLLARGGHGTPAPVAAVDPVVSPQRSAEPATPPVAPQVAKPDPVIAAAIESPHEEVAEPRPVTAADHLRIARGLEREAAKNRRLAAQQYRNQAAHYRQLALADRKKAQNSARIANTYQRLAQRSMRRGA